LLTRATPTGANACLAMGDSAPVQTQATSTSLQTADVGTFAAGTGEQPAPAAPSQPGTNMTTVYPGNYYIPYAGQQAGPLAAPGAAPVSDQAKTAKADDLTAGAEAASEKAGEKPPEALGATARGKQKSPAKSEKASSENSTQGAVALAYQFIAGQWVPQPTAQPAVQTQASAVTPDATPGVAGAPAVSLPASGIASFKNSLPAQEKPVAQKTAGAVSAQANAVGAFVQAGKKTAPTPAGAAAPAGNSAGVAKPKDQAPALPETTAPASTRLVLPGDGTAGVAKTDDRIVGSSSKATTVLASLSAEDKSPGAGATSPTDPATEGAGTSVTTGRLLQGRAAQLQAAEKIADPRAPDRSEFASGVNASASSEEKKSLIIDNKELTPNRKNIGTSAANREIAMPDSVATKPSAAVLSPVTNDRLQTGDVSTTVQTAGTFAAHAPRLVQEIRQIADRISVIDRNSVEVRFDFSDTARLSVRVEYRDGTVHTTFKTDSSQLQDAISHEWQAQSVASEQRPYRVAEPVFSQTTSDRQNSSSLGDGSSRQRSFEQPAQSAAPSFTPTGRNTGASSSAAAPAVRSLRPETSLHLHTFA
jgi:hypothetical protein